MSYLNAKAFGGLLFLLLVMAALLFLPAWTLDYWQARVFLAVFGASALAITLYLMKKDPKLLERRVYGGPTAEKETSQKIIQSIAAIGVTAVIVVSALDHRFGWSAMSPYVTVAGDILVALGFLIMFFVVQRKYFRLGNYQTLSRTESHIDRTVRTRTPPDVYGSPFLVRWHAALAWLVVGIVRAPPSHARAYLETFR